MEYSEIKQVKKLCEELFSEPDWREVVENLSSDEGSEDFEVDGVRFIDSDSIDKIQQEELGSDTYILGCFNSWFLASVLDIDEDVIIALQECEKFEAVGKLVISSGKLAELQEAYASADGYGHHFNRYDFGEEGFRIPSYNKLYYVFDNH